MAGLSDPYKVGQAGDWCFVMVAEAVEVSGMAQSESNIHDS